MNFSQDGFLPADTPPPVGVAVLIRLNGSISAARDGRMVVACRDDDGSWALTITGTDDQPIRIEAREISGWKPVDANPMSLDEGTVLRVRYRNYRGEEAVRSIRPLSLRFGASEYHTGFLLACIDTERSVLREFALADCDFLSLNGEATPE